MSRQRRRPVGEKERGKGRGRDEKRGKRDDDSKIIEEREKSGSVMFRP
jgi:hypothetical protein